MGDLLAQIDALARIQLAVQRTGRLVSSVHASDELRELAVFIGLADVLRVEVRGQAVEGEQGLGVEEERALDDASA